MDIGRYREIALATEGTTIDVPGEPYYAVRTRLVAPEPGEWYWHLALVHHLTGQENGGKNHLFLEAIDEAGQPVRGPAYAVAWTWKDRRDDEPAEPVRFDKPASEAGGNIGIHWGQRVEAWMILGGLKSDVIYDVHTMWPDGQPGNTRAHHSCLAVWVKRQFAGAPEPPPLPEPGEQVKALLVELDNWETDAVAQLLDMFEKLGKLKRRYRDG